MSTSPYTRQDRGDPESYARYLAGMDASMRQKVALTAAHLLAEGIVADMGMGSGTGSHALAALYPGLEVVGVDVSTEMVERARERHVLPNLRFEVGDVADPVFPEGSLQAILDSSVLHHVTSFGGYDRGAAARALAVQARQLAVGGVLVVRDFVDPGDAPVLLDLPDDDGDGSDDPRTCSSARLLLRFAEEFRKLSAAPGFACAEVPGSRPGWRRFRVAHVHAVEFLLRKDYRADWDTEVLEEYTYLTQAGFERVLSDLGLRVLASTPLHNPWIRRHRLVGRCALVDPSGAPRELPATNYVVVGERVPPGEGVRLSEGERVPPTGFLTLAHYRDRETGKVRDLVRRPGLTLDVLPYFEAGSDVHVLARRSYPRPVLCAAGCGPGPLDGSRSVGYVTEPIAVIQQDRPLGRTVEETLAEAANLGSDAVLAFRSGTTYYPSPGGLEEEVRSVLVSVAPRFVERRVTPRSGFSTSGQVRAIEARQLLRAAQVGGLPDARLELNVYELLRQLGRDPGPWIGEALDVPESGAAPGRRALVDLAVRPARRRFEAVGAAHAAGFLDLRAAEFLEHDAVGRVVARQVREYVVPWHLGVGTVAVALLRRAAGEVLVAVDDDDLPAAQGFTGNSQLLVAPAWRLPRDFATLTAAQAFLAARLAAEHGVTAGEVFSLGGPYHPSAGVTPEVVHPLAVALAAEAPAPRPLAWVPLAEAAARPDLLLDGHLRIVVLRAAHALGLLVRSSGS